MARDDNPDDPNMSNPDNFEDRDEGRDFLRDMNAADRDPEREDRSSMSGFSDEDESDSGI